MGVKVGALVAAFNVGGLFGCIIGFKLYKILPEEE